MYEYINYIVLFIPINVKCFENVCLFNQNMYWECGMRWLLSNSHQQENC